MTRLLAYLPRGNTLDDRAWHKRHVFLQGLLLLHLLLLYAFGLFMGRSAWDTMVVLSVPAACLVLGHLITHRRTASVLITAGLTYGSAVLVSFSNGSIEAHFHFFIMIGFIALYQDWVPFLWNVVFTVLSHGLGSVARTDLIFNHPSGQTSPWVWSAIHGVAVLAACCGVVIFWETTEREQRKTLELTKQLADAEITRRRFTSDLLVNLARRNQSLLYRQLGLINQLEDQAEDPDALADLFQLDHLATRIRRNAESLLVLSGEEPPRTWGRPVALVDVVRAAIAETEDLDRVVFAVDERLAVFGNAVADLTHLMAELVENAVHFSPPEASVIIRTRPYLQTPGAHVLTVEDWGVGMRADDMAAANDLLATPRTSTCRCPSGWGCTWSPGSPSATASRCRSPPPRAAASPPPWCSRRRCSPTPTPCPTRVRGRGRPPGRARPGRPGRLDGRPGRRPPAGAGGLGAGRGVDRPHRRAGRERPRPRRPAGTARRRQPVPAGDTDDWSGWWEPSPGDPRTGSRCRRSPPAPRCRAGPGPAAPAPPGRRSPPGRPPGRSPRAARTPAPGCWGPRTGG